IQSPIVKRFRDRKRFIRAPAGFEPAIHEFRLPFHKRKTAFCMGAFPFVEKVYAVNLGPRICAGFVGAKCARNAGQHHLSWTKIDGIFPTGDPDEILQAARLTIGRYAVEKHSVVTRIPERKSRAAAPILRRKDQLRIPRYPQRPASLRANAAQSIRSQKEAVDQRIIDKIPSIRMNRIEPAEGGKELPAFQLEIERQVRRLHECFLYFDLGFVVVVQLENDVRESFEVRVNRAVERELDVARVESSLLRIVVADLDVIEVACAGIGEREQAVEGDVHVISAAADSNWLR